MIRFAPSLRKLTCAATIAVVFATPPSFAADGRFDWPDAVKRQLELVDLLKAEEFADLENRIAASAGNRKNGAVGEPNTDIFGAFSRAEPELAGPLARWRNAYPKSFAPYLAFGLYGAAVGSKIRGEEYVYLTNRKRFEEMGTYFDTAEDSLKKALKINPHLEAAWETLIDLAKTRGKKIEMMSYLNGAIENLSKPSNAYRHYFWAIAPKWHGTLKERLALKIRIMQKYPNDPAFAWIDTEEEFEKAWKLYDDDHYAEALEKFKALAAVRETGGVHRGIAWSLVTMGKTAEGVAEMGKAISTAPTNAYFYEQRSRMRRALPEMRAAARRDLETALALDPYDPRYLAAHARYLLDDGKYNGAKRDLDRALFFGAYDDVVRDAWRNYYMRIGDPEAALKEAELMVTLVPGNLRNHLVYGVMLHENEDCRGVPVLQQYLKACRSSKSCNGRDEGRAEVTLQMLEFGCN
jgi:tetratricopeptide (TPR) repeat protein